MTTVAKKLKRKRRSSYTYEGLGFPVALLNVPMVRSMGMWTPDVDYRKLAGSVLGKLALHPGRLTGRQVRFIRHSMGMTVKKFGGRFGVTHPAVVQWEQCGARSTRMAWALEKDIRLVVWLQGASSAARFVKAYDELASERPRKEIRPVEIRF